MSSAAQSLLKPVLGSFRILRRRARDVGQPALAVWTDAGEKAARELGAGVAQAAHASETYDLEAQQALAAGLAGLTDGRIDPEDIEHLRRAARLVARSAELDHDIGEAVALVEEKKFARSSQGFAEAAIGRKPEEIAS